MPEELAGATRAADEGVVTYVEGDGVNVATIEVMEVADMLAAGQEPEAMFGELEAMVNDPATCSTTLELCVGGTGPDGKPATLWSSVDADLVFVAVAVTEERLEQLIAAWDQAIASTS